MKNSHLFNLFLFLFVSFTSFSQNRAVFTEPKEERNVTQIRFSDRGIILNNKISFKYERIGNDFTIRTIDGTDLIKGVINNLEDNKFETLITFLQLDVEFTNHKIIGRNDLIFALADFNVFKKDLTINEDKLLEFIDLYNELK